MKRGTAKHLVHRRLRRELGLLDEDDVVTMWLGPPEVSLVKRAALLAGIRDVLSAQRCEIQVARKGLVEVHPFRRQPVHDLTGLAAAQQLEMDERNADRESHWWLHDVIWGSTSGTYVYAGVDPDGNDLSFIGWGGPAVADTMLRLEHLILAHRPM